MRAVGHVIRNRKQAESHGAYVTDTVSAAFQFQLLETKVTRTARSCSTSMRCPEESEGPSSLDRCQAARRRDPLWSIHQIPQDGALFYHTTAVRPAWSRGVAPIARIGDHLFFRTVL
jgi:hypothetical protein